MIWLRLWVRITAVAALLFSASAHSKQDMPEAIYAIAMAIFFLLAADALESKDCK